MRSMFQTMVELQIVGAENQGSLQKNWGIRNRHRTAGEQEWKTKSELILNDTKQFNKK